MIDNTALLALKSRMLLAAEAAEAIVKSPDVVRYDEQQYWLVHEALSSLRTDVLEVLSEIDTWREMFADRLNSFVTGGVTNEVRSGGHGSDAGNDVPVVEEPRDGGGGEEVRPDATETPRPVPATRPRRGRRKRPDAGGNKAGVQDRSGSVDAGAGAGEVGGESESVN